MTTTHINLGDFLIKETLGVGAFGRVRLAQHRTDNYCVALKILKKGELVKQKQVDHVINEFRVLRVLDHPFVVNLRGIAQDNCYLVFALDYVPGGELFTYLRRASKFDSATAAVYAAQVICVFEYLHSQDIIYRDLKPENLLLDTNGYLKLTDFGFAKFLSSGRTFTLCGTPGYLAPEILLNRGHGKPVDWWALGVLIYEMLTGAEPFADDDPMSVYRKILSGKVSYPRDFNKDAKSLVKHLLEHDLTKRYGNRRQGVSDLKTHRWFRKHCINWTSLLCRELSMPLKPGLRTPTDTSNFARYPDSTTRPEPIEARTDPFINW
mmetsp:Transcript_18474/g.33268  ORF Transcript_18474/g.33268 Transcript_18474/m.33268 type:complete len:322 (+) Transcript_18474:48-1013(+)